MDIQGAQEIQAANCTMNDRIDKELQILRDVEIFRDIQDTITNIGLFKGN